MLILSIKVFIHNVLIHNNHFIRQTGNLKARDCISNFMMIKWKNNFWIILRISWKIVFHRRDSMTICLLAETYNEWQWKCNVSYFYERHSFSMIINIKKGVSYDSYTVFENDGNKFISHWLMTWRSWIRSFSILMNKKWDKVWVDYIKDNF